MAPGMKPDAAAGNFKENPSDREAQLRGSAIQGKAGSRGEETACGKGNLQGQASPVPRFSLRVSSCNGEHTREPPHTSVLPALHCSLKDRAVFRIFIFIFFEKNIKSILAVPGMW